MAEVGKVLQQAREKLGYTLEEMHEITNIDYKYLQALEEDCFDQIPSPFYVRAFIKAYARKLYVNPLPLINRYESLQKKQETSSNSLPMVISPGDQKQTQPSAETLPSRRKTYAMRLRRKKGTIFLWLGICGTVLLVGIGLYYFWL